MLTLLKRYLRLAEFRTLRRRLVSIAQARGIKTDEDVFYRLQKSGSDIQAWTAA